MDLLISLQNFTNSTEEVLPDIQCPYEPPELCAAGSMGLSSNQVIVFGFVTITVIAILDQILCFFV